MITTNPHEHHTLETEFKGVLSNGVYRLFVGNGVGVSLIQSVTTPMIPNLLLMMGYAKNGCMAVSPPVARTA